MNTWEILEKLEANWDSYKAYPIDPRAIATGKLLEPLLKENFPDIQFFPTANGGVEFEGTDAVLSINERGQIDEIYGGCE